MHDTSKRSTAASIAGGAFGRLAGDFLTYSFGLKSSFGVSKWMKRVRIDCRRRSKLIGTSLFGGRLIPKPRFSPRIERRSGGSFVEGRQRL